MTSPAVLAISTGSVAYGDVPVTSNPKRQYWNWSRSLLNIPVSNPKSEQYTVPPRSMLTLFNGTRLTTIDDTTLFTVQYMGESRYRFSWVGGTDPSFETNVALSVVDAALTLTVNANQTVSLSGPPGSFTGVSPGHVLYVYGPADKTTSAFNPSNAGKWRVLAATATLLMLARFSGEDFVAMDETVTASSGTDFIVYSPSNGVQEGDKVRIDGGFVPDTFRTYEIQTVTSQFFDVVSTSPIAEQSNIAPGASGMVFYSSAKKYMRLEVDQEAKIYINGATDEGQVVSPFVAGDPEQMGWQERTGPVWGLIVYNRSQQPMTLALFTAE